MKELKTESGTNDINQRATRKGTKLAVWVITVKHILEADSTQEKQNRVPTSYDLTESNLDTNRTE